MIVITGATGKLGRHVLGGLLAKLPATQIVAAVRSAGKAADLADMGVQVREADYNRPETLRTAFAGAEKVLLISGTEIGQRVAQHGAVIAAAKAAGVKLLAYTSLLRADSSSLLLAREHKPTEEILRASGVPFVLLRNGWYLENHTEQLRPALEHGAVPGAAGEGRFAAASRADYAAAAVAVLTGAGFEGRTLELAGDSSYTLRGLAAEVARQAERPVAYRNLTVPEYQAMLESAGLPASLAEVLADSDRGAAKGELDSDSRELHELIGRPTTSLREAVGAALGELAI